MEFSLLPFHSAPNKPRFKTSAVSALPKLSGIRALLCLNINLEWMHNSHLRACLKKSLDVRMILTNSWVCKGSWNPPVCIRSVEIVIFSTVTLHLLSPSQLRVTGDRQRRGILSQPCVMLLRDDSMGRGKGCSQPLTPLCTAQTNSTAHTSPALPEPLLGNSPSQEKNELKKKKKGITQKTYSACKEKRPRTQMLGSRKDLSARFSLSTKDF